MKNITSKNYYAIKSLEDFMNTLSIDTKNDKIRDFLRFHESRETYFTSDDTQEDILRTKNIWAGYAYAVLLDKIGENPLTPREETFLEVYFNQYLSEISSVKLENDLKGFYIRYRLSKDFQYNVDAIDPHTLWANHPGFENGLEEYKKTISLAMSLIYKRNITIELEEETFDRVPKDITYLAKANKIILNKKFFSDNYIESLRSSVDVRNTYDLLYKICCEMELYELNNIRKNEISVTALIYTIEDYLYSKALKVNGVGKAYAALYKNTIAHKLIDVDARERAFDKLVSAFSLNINNRYGAMGDLINHHLNDLLIDNNHLRHYIADAKYFDTNNLQDDAFSKLFAMYVNGLKAMPKTKLTNVTKYFAINGNTLTVLDMNLIIKDYDHKIAKLEKAIENAKDEDEIISLTSKKDAIEIEKNNVKKVMKYIKDRVISYQIEEKLLKYTSDEKLSKEEKTEIYDHILDLCFDNYSEYLEMKHRVKHMYDQLDNLAGSNSPSKIALIRFKESTLSKMIKAFDDLDQYLEWKKLQLSSNFEFEDASRTLVIHEVKDMDKVISLVQELIGRGVITSEKMIKDSIENGTPLMRNLNPGFKEFAQDALAAKGVKEFKKKKPKKQ